MLKDNQFPGVVEIISEGSHISNSRPMARDYIVDNDDHEQEVVASSSRDAITASNSLSSYLILSPSSPLRTFAISFLSHWIYSTVIIVTICAFVISSVHNFYRNFDVHVNGSKGNSLGKLEKVDEIPRAFGVLEVTRGTLLAVLLSEMVIKLIARGFLFTGKFAYLRIPWDWLDALGLVLIVSSIMIPWKALEFSAAAVFLVKLIPILPGSINAFIFLCSCAKKLIPVLVYGIIIICVYGTVIFTLFVKYQQEVFVDDPRESVSKSNESTSDRQNENIETFKKNLVDSPLVAGVESDLFPVTSSAHEKSQNFSFTLTMECLPANFRSLSGSLIQAIRMLTLQKYSHDGTEEAQISSVGSSAQTPCQSEMYILSIIETLVIISGTLPMISMTFSALLNFFQKSTNMTKNTQDSLYHDGNHHHSLLNRSDSGESGGSQQRHEKNCQETSSLSSCFSSSLKEVANILCDCDYYFCCLASLQRKFNPCASGLLNSNKFKVFVLLVVSTDFLAMILLTCFTESTHCAIDFPDVTSTWLLISWVKVCFGLYTVEALFKWCALASEEYWMNIWSAFDLLVVLVHWVGYIIIHFFGSNANHCLIYVRLCGILMIRMLKIVPYWEPLEQTLKLTWLSIFGNLHNLFVILICSGSSILLKYAALMLEAKWTSSELLPMDLMPSVPLNIYVLVESVFQLVLYFLFAFVVTAIYFQVFEALKTSPNDGSTSNPSISLLLNNHRDSQFSEMTIMSCSTHHLHPRYEPRRSFHDSSSPISVMHGVTNSIHHRNKYRMAASSPFESNNGLLLTPDTRSIMSPRSSDVLSPLLTIPTPNGLNGNAYNMNNMSDRLSHLSEENMHSRIGETTSANNSTLQNFFSSCSCSSIEDAFNLTSAFVVILASINIVLATPGNQMTWRSLYLGRSLWLEVVFIMSIALHIIYRTRLLRFPRETFLQMSSLVDLIVILAAAAEVYSSGMRWVPIQNDAGRGITFLQCAKVLSASRGLLLISRISWLQCIGSALCYLFWKVLKHLSAFGYFWIIFMVSATEMQKMIAAHGSGQNATPLAPISFNSTNATEKYRNGNETLSFTALSTENDIYFIVHPVLIAVSTLLLLLTFGTSLGFLHHRLQNFSKLFEKFITPNQVAYQRSKIWQSQPIQFSFPVPDSTPKPTEGLCVPILFYVANHPTFDFIVMAIIFLDALGIALEHFGTSDRAMILRKHYPAYMLFLYGMELTSKLVGNGVKFFKSYWNIFDCIVVSVSIVDFFVCLIDQSWIALLIQNLRFLRILRIFQFTPFVKRTTVIQGFFLSIPKAIFILWNVSTFYFCLYLATAVVRFRCGYEEGDDILETTSFLHVLSAPIVGIINMTNILNCVGNNCVSSFTFSYIFYLITLAIFFFLRLSVVFCVCLVLAIVLCQYLQEQDYKASCNVSPSTTFYHDNDDEDMDHVQNGGGEDKTSFLMPCITPDTSYSHDIETPICSTSTSRHILPPSPSTSTRPVQNNGDENENTGLYNTTTFTSTREINGCKVFFVEAMITTV